VGATVAVGRASVGEGSTGAVVSTAVGVAVGAQAAIANTKISNRLTILKLAFIFISFRILSEMGSSQFITCFALQ